MFKMDRKEIVAAGKQPQRVQARSLLCYWAVRELGLGVTSVARLLGLTQPAVSRAVQQGERSTREQGYRLKEIRSGKA